MFTVLLDSPDKPIRQIQIAKLGDFSDARYGDFSITAENVANWQRNLSKLPGGEALIDFEHRSERKPRDSKAAGWISSIQIDGDRVMADARWTPAGEASILNEEYRFLSPVFGPTQIESETVDDALPSVALTNKPFLASMPSLMLASEERVSEAVSEEIGMLLEVALRDDASAGVSETTFTLLESLTTKARNNLPAESFAIPEGRAYPIHDISHARNALARASGKPEEGRVKAAVYKRYPELKPDSKSLDSRAPMNPDILKALDLGDDADDAKLLEAIETLKTEASKPSKKQVRKTLEQEASDKGLLLLDAKEAKQLRLDAAAGALASRELHGLKFEQAFKDAEEAGKVTEAEREGLQHFYTLDSAATLAMLEARRPVVQTQPTGRPVIEFDPNGPDDPAQVAAAGRHPGSHELQKKLDAYMKENKIGPAGYPMVLEQVMNGTVTL